MYLQISRSFVGGIHVINCIDSVHIFQPFRMYLTEFLNYQQFSIAKVEICAENRLLH